MSEVESQDVTTEQNLGSELESVPISRLEHILVGLSGSESQNRVKNVTAMVREMLAIFVSFGAILAATGVVIVNSYLAQFGAIQGFSVIPGRYISASLWFLLLFLVSIGYTVITVKFFKRNNIGKPIGVTFAALFVIYVVLGRYFDWQTLDSNVGILVICILVNSMIGFFVFIEEVMFRWEKELETQSNLLKNPNKTIDLRYYSRLYFMRFLRVFILPSKLYNRFVLLGLGWILVYGIFGILLYPNIPQYWGGGQPLPAELILKRSEVTDNLPLSLVTGTQRTQPILILAELNDGLLIHDSQLGKTLILKNEFVGAIIDISIP